MYTVAKKRFSNHAEEKPSSSLFPQFGTLNNDTPTKAAPFSSNDGSLSIPLLSNLVTSQFPNLAGPSTTMNTEGKPAKPSSSYFTSLLPSFNKGHRPPLKQSPTSFSPPASSLSNSSTSQTLKVSTHKEKATLPMRHSGFLIPCLAAFCVGIALTTITMSTNFSAQSKVPKKTFSDILAAQGSDKVWKHHYEQYYDKWFSPYRSTENVKVLEIGARQTPTLTKWLNYFDSPPALIQGLAPLGSSILHEKQFPKGVESMQGDPTEVVTQNSIRPKGPFDIIIDDGSHVPAHMISTLFGLWESLKPGGIYVIEGLETSYWRDGERVAQSDTAIHGAGIGGTPHASFVEKLKQLLDVMIKSDIGAPELQVMPGDDLLCSVNWGRNIVALYKCDELERKNAPIMQQAVFDESKMLLWLQDAKASNPDGFK